MTTALDRKLLPKVATIIGKVGVDATFSLTGATQYDPETGEVNPEDPDQVTIKSTPPLGYGTDILAGSIEPDDAYVYIAGRNLAFTPAIGMQVAIGGKSWGIVSVTKLVSGDEIAAFKLQLRV